MQLKNFKFIQGVNFELIENLPNNRTKYLLIFDDSRDEYSNSKQLLKTATAGKHRVLEIKFFSSKQIAKKYRVTRSAHILFQATERHFTNQYFKSATWTRISTKRGVSRCIISS